MAFQLSAGVNFSEIDLTTVVPAVATSDAAIAGVFRWGPVGERILIDSETLLAKRFGKPTSYNAETYYSAANFLSYSNRLWVARAANTSGENGRASLTTNIYISNLSISGSSSGYSNTDTINVVSQYGTNATAIITTNSTGGIATLSITSRGYGFNTSPTVSILASNGSASAGSNATITPVLASNNTTRVILGSANGTVAAGMYVTQTSDSSVIPTEVNISSITGNLYVFDSNLSNGSATIYTGHPETSYSAVALETNGFVSNLVNQIVLNENDYETKEGNFDTNVLYIAKYPGDLGNSLRIAICDNSDSFNSTVNIVSNNITFTIGSTNTSVVCANSSESSALAASVSVGDLILAGNSTIGRQYLKVNNINNYSNTVTFTFETPYRLRSNYSSNTFQRFWEFSNVVETAPGQSDYVANFGNTSAQDEMHVVVVDNGGGFTGTPGTILEIFKGVSRATDSKNNDGSVNYYKDVINQNSAYIWWANDRGNAESANAVLVASSTTTAPGNYTLTLGSDGASESDSNAYAPITRAYDLFASPEDIDISLIIQGRPLGGSTSINGVTVENFQLANYIIDNICEIRRDCVALISPEKDMIINSFGTEATNLVAWRGALRSTSYAVLDSGYKYQYDKYNDVYRWIPLNGDIAGLCARTDQTNDAWWSPAGFNRGQIKNLVKLAYNPRKAERDVLYSNGVNPVVTFPGQGTVLYGDKTLQAKPSAFDRINVRRLFIVLEKAISVSAKYSLFEFNDAFTRSQFKNLVTPYLRTIKGRRGITDFLVVCDDTNNTAQIIDTNQFVGDIYIKPARSINFIQLNFVAVGTGVQFSEVVGRF